MSLEVIINKEMEHLIFGQESKTDNNRNKEDFINKETGKFGRSSLSSS